MHCVTAKPGAQSSPTGRRTTRVSADSTVRNAKEAQRTASGITTTDPRPDHSKLRCHAQQSQNISLKTRVKPSHGLKLNNGLMLNQMVDFQVLRKFKRSSLPMQDSHTTKMLPSDRDHLHSGLILFMSHQEPTKVYLVSKELIIEVTKQRPSLARHAKIGDLTRCTNITKTSRLRNQLLESKQDTTSAETQMAKIQFGAIQRILPPDGSFATQSQPLALGLQLLKLTVPKATSKSAQFMVLQLPPH